MAVGRWVGGRAGGRAGGRGSTAASSTSSNFNPICPFVPIVRVCFVAVLLPKAAVAMTTAAALTPVRSSASLVLATRPLVNDLVGVGGGERRGEVQGTIRADADSFRFAYLPFCSAGGGYGNGGGLAGGGDLPHDDNVALGG